MHGPMNVKKKKWRN